MGGGMVRCDFSRVFVVFADLPQSSRKVQAYLLLLSETGSLHEQSVYDSDTLGFDVS